MAIQDIRLKIHHIDGDMTAPWEYIDTFSKVGVGTPMAFGAERVSSYDFVALVKRMDEEGKVLLKDIWISMGEYTDGASFDELMDAMNSGDESALDAVLSKAKTVPAVYLRNDMVLESVSPITEYGPGDQLFLRTASTGNGEFIYGWQATITEDAEGYGLFTVIDAQPMVEGQTLPQKLLLRYIG